MSALARDTLIAVGGAGARGPGIAQAAALAGHRVRLLDNRPDVAARAVAGIRAQLAKMVEKGRLSAADAAAAGMRLIPAHEIADLAAAGLVVEAIVEDLAEKQALFADLEDIVGRDCILCTNTSSISITVIGTALRHPERLAGLHFFNPAPLMVLVEVVSPVSPPTRRVPRYCSPPPPPGARPRSMPSRRQGSSSIASPAPTTPRRRAWRRRVPTTAQPSMPLCARPAASAWGRSS